jgi:tetratricopeptide (TPR) repeat protein
MGTRAGGRLRGRNRGAIKASRGGEDVNLGAMNPLCRPRGSVRPPVPGGTKSLREVAESYQRVLMTNPKHAESLAGMCVVALASGQNEAAVRMAEAAVDAAPEMAVAHVALGQALKACGRNEEAERAYGKALDLSGAEALAWLGLGELRLAAGKTEEAKREFERALHCQPALVPAHMGLGNALAMEGNSETALASYERALRLRGKLPEGEFAAGYVLARMGKHKEAERRYRRALVLRPDFAAAWMNLGALLHEEGRDLYAEAALRRAVELRPDLAAGWLNLAMLERERDRTEAAEACLQKAFALNPEQVETHIAWCQLSAKRGDTAGAWGWLSRALARNAEHPEALNMMGILLHKEGRFAEAIEAFERAEAVGHLAASSNRGNCLLDMGRMDEALAAHELAVGRDPQHPGARYNLALTQIRLGDWKRGWPGYEARWGFREVHRRPRVFRQQRWRGEPLEGQRVLLHAEQGLGDTIQFCRYAALVAARGGFPVLQVQQPVERLMRSLALVQAGSAEVARLGERNGLSFDLECPLLSLPAVFGTTPETVPWQGAYLAADGELPANRWVARTFGAGRIARQDACLGGLRVGVAWAGNPRYKADAQRSMHLRALTNLLRTPGIVWVSLQKGSAAEQISELDGDVRLLDGSSGDRDLADTAALVAGLDLVITTDTAIAHLAGAMARPVWILLPHLADWRWGNEGESSPWYPTARLYRQATAGDWEGLLGRVISDLIELNEARPRTVWRRRAPECQAVEQGSA